MERGGTQDFDAPEGLLTIEDCLDERGDISFPPGTTLISLVERNIANIGDTVEEFRGLVIMGEDDGVALALQLVDGFDIGRVERPLDGGNDIAHALIDRCSGAFDFGCPEQGRTLDAAKRVQARR